MTNIIPIIGAGVLLASMIGGKLYPKQTIVIVVTVSLIALAYPLLRYIDASKIRVCP
jgi:predicted MFS family arabinose efflux permease